MKNIVPVDVHKSGLNGLFASFWFISKSFFGGVWTRNVFALNDLHTVLPTNCLSVISAHSIPLPPLMVNPYVREWRVICPELLYALFCSTFWSFQSSRTVHCKVLDICLSRQKVIFFSRSLKELACFRLVVDLFIEGRLLCDGTNSTERSKCFL